MSATVSLLTANARRLLRRPFLDNGAQKPAMQDSSWADVSIRPSPLYRSSKAPSSLTSVSTTGPAWHRRRLRRLLAPGPLLRPAARHTLLHRQRVDRALPATDSAPRGPRPFLGRRVLSALGLRQRAQAHQAGSSGADRDGAHEHGCELVPENVQTHASGHYGDAHQLVRLPAGCV